MNQRGVQGRLSGVKLKNLQLLQRWIISEHVGPDFSDNVLAQVPRKDEK